MRAPILSRKEKEAWKKIAQERDIFKEFVKHREALKDKNVSGPSAWLEAAQLMGWVHHEKDPHYTSFGHMQDQAGDCPDCEDVPVKKVSLDDRLEPLPSEGIVTPQKDASLPVERAPARVTKDGRVLMSREMAAEKPSQPITADVEWAVEHTAIDGILPQDAPTAKAWSLYSNAMASVKSMEGLMQHHQRMMPTGKQLDKESGFGDLAPRKLVEWEKYLESTEHIGILGADALLLSTTEIPSMERVVSQEGLKARRRE
jgi:hypothetical protein